MPKYSLYETSDAGQDPTWWFVKTSDDMSEIQETAAVYPRWHIADDEGTIIAEGGN